MASAAAAATSTGGQAAVAAAATAAAAAGGWSIADFELGPAIGKGRFGHVYYGRDKASGR
jgi:hypothetical protein